MSKSDQTLIIPIWLIRKDQKLTAFLCLGQMSLESLMIKEKQESVLHPKEKKYFEALRFDRRKASYLMGRYCAKKALSYQLKGQKLNTILIKSGVFEQPIVYAPENKGMQVSIAHSGDLGCALAFNEEHPMAIDLEMIDPEFNGVIDTQLTTHNSRKTTFARLLGQRNRQSIHMDMGVLAVTVRECNSLAC